MRLRSLRYVFAFLLITLAVVFIFSRFKTSYQDIPALLDEANKKPLWLVLCLSLLSYLAYGLLSKILLKIGGNHVSLGDTIKVGILGVLGFQVAPFVGGTILLYLFYKKLKVPSSAIFFLLTVLTALNWINYLFFSFLAAILLPSSFSSLFPQTAVLVFLFSLLFLLVLGYFLFKERAKRLIAILCFLVRPLNRMAQPFLKRDVIGPAKTKRIIEELWRDLDLLLARPGQTVQAVCVSVFSHLLNITLLYLSFYVFGYSPNVLLLILGLTASSVIALLSLFPEAPGVAEASLVTVFVGLGFPAHVSLFACLLYRLVSYWLPLPLGIFVYLDLNGLLKPKIDSRSQPEYH